MDFHKIESDGSERIEVGRIPARDVGKDNRMRVASMTRDGRAYLKCFATDVVSDAETGDIVVIGWREPIGGVSAEDLEAEE